MNFQSEVSNIAFVRDVVGNSLFLNPFLDIKITFNLLFEARKNNIVWEDS